MGPLPQTPTDYIVPLSLTLFIGDKTNMCQSCTFADDVAEEIFHDINMKLNGRIAINDTVCST